MDDAAPRRRRWVAGLAGLAVLALRLGLVVRWLTPLPELPAG